MWERSGYAGYEPNIMYRRRRCRRHRRRRRVVLVVFFRRLYDGVRFHLALIELARPRPAAR